MRCGSPTFLIVIDLLTAVLSLMLAHLFTLDETWPLSSTVGPGGSTLILFTVLVIFSSHFCEIYRWENSFGEVDFVARVWVSAMLAFFMFSSLSFLIPGAMPGRALLSTSLIIFAVLQFFIHHLFLSLLGASFMAVKVMVLGSGPLAEKVERLLMEQNSGRQKFLGFVKPETDVCTVKKEKIIGDVDDIENLVRETGAERLVIAVTERRGTLPVRKLLNCKLKGIDVIDVQMFYEEMTRKLLIENFQPSTFIYSNGFKVTAFRRFIKRVFDLFFSMFGMAVTLPLWPIIGILVKADSAGPIFFRQIRVGEGGRNFTLYKFRTMCHDAEKECGAVWAVENDPRVTKVGKFLRNSRLDELPQLYNVLKGDMSFVGPRPERPEFVERLSELIPYYFVRHTTKPGVTGWAQIFYPYGASDEDAKEKLRYDLYYLKNYSLILDFYIVLETTKVVFLGRGGR